MKNNSISVLVWDLPTRIFHWLLVTAYTGCWLTFDDNRYLYIHVISGYIFLGLLIFRLVWGGIGSRYARFRSFAYDWPSVYAYLKALLTGEASRYIGHNPIGGWVIIFMIGLGFAVTLTGLVVLGGEEVHGPLRGLVPFAIGNATKPAHEWLAFTMLAVTLIHFAGVVVESVIHKENLIWSMITGRKESSGSESGVLRHGVMGIVVFLVVAIVVAVAFRGYVTQTTEKPFIPFKGPQLADNTLWRSACGECHLAYHPTLLPARSWEKMLETQADHFGEDLGLDEATVAELRAFMTANAAESGLTEPAHKVNASIPKDKTPLRITKTDYWIKKHRDIAEQYWHSPPVEGKMNCGACHLDASRGTYEDAAMRLPKLK